MLKVVLQELVKIVLSSYYAAHVLHAFQLHCFRCYYLWSHEALLRHCLSETKAKLPMLFMIQQNNSSTLELS